MLSGWVNYIWGSGEDADHAPTATADVGEDDWEFVERKPVAALTKSAKPLKAKASKTVSKTTKTGSTESGRASPAAVMVAAMTVESIDGDVSDVDDGMDSAASTPTYPGAKAVRTGGARLPLSRAQHSRRQVAHILFSAPTDESAPALSATSSARKLTKSLLNRSNGVAHMSGRKPLNRAAKIKSFGHSNANNDRKTANC